LGLLLVLSYFFVHKVTAELYPRIILSLRACKA
jgi:hypothetical protein